MPRGPGRPPSCRRPWGRKEVDQFAIGVLRLGNRGEVQQQESQLERTPFRRLSGVFPTLAPDRRHDLVGETEGFEYVRVGEFLQALLDPARDDSQLSTAFSWRRRLAVFPSRLLPVGTGCFAIHSR